MDSRLSSLPDWYRALSLTERVERLRAGETIGTGSIDCERSERRQRQWQAQPPFATGAGIEPRLAVDGITREEWARVLGEPPERLRDCGPAAPAWLETVVSAYAAPRPDRADSSLYVEREASDAGQLLPFAELAGPLVEAARTADRAARELLRNVEPSV